jgi:hypothetical protein
MRTGGHNPDLLSHLGGAFTLGGWVALATFAALVLLSRRDVS